MYEDNIRPINMINDSSALTKIKNINRKTKVKVSLKSNNKLNIYDTALLVTGKTKFVNDAGF